MKNNTKEAIIECLMPKLKRLGLSVSDIDMNLSLIEQGILDSISFLEFIVDLEAAFNMDFDMSELNPTEFTSINKLIGLIENKVLIK